MAILRPLNEFSRESVVMALEPSRECSCHCTYCFSTLNSKAQSDGRSKDLSDPSTFESTISKAYSPHYDPTNFSQWALKNKLVLGYANTVEPFQDVLQATSILRTCDQYGLPLFIQTKGYNFFEVWTYLKPFHDNAVLFLSFPTDNDEALRRFEVGTPLSEHRFKVLETAAQSGFHVILALSPYHEDWCDDPASFIEKCHSLGAKSVFVDRLHLNQRQRKVARDQVMIDMADNTMASDWPEKMLDHYRIIYDKCDDLEMGIFASGYTPTMHGMYSTLASISPVGVYSRGFQWPYHDGTLFFNLQLEFQQMYDSREIDILNRDFTDSIVVQFDDLINLLEIDGRRVDQEFSFSSLADLMAVKNIPPTWQQNLKPRATIQEYYRALWNNPSKKQFAWRHPWAKIAMQSDGSPWLDDDGNLMLVFDPDLKYYASKERIIEDIDELRFFTLEE